MRVTIHAAKTNLSRLIEAALSGEEVVIARRGTPAARLVPIDKKPAKRPIGLDVGKAVIHDDFNDPLPDDFMKAFE